MNKDIIEKNNVPGAPHLYNPNLIQILTTEEALKRGFLPTGRSPAIIVTKIEEDSINKVKVYIPQEIVPKDARAYVPEIPHGSIGQGRSIIAVQFYR